MSVTDSGEQAPAEVHDGTTSAEPEPEPEPVVQLRHLRRTFGSTVAVDDIDLDVPAGAIYGVIGPNGAGKTTTFAVIATLLTPTSGQVRVLGTDPTRDPREVRRRLGYMPDQLGLYDTMTVREYLDFFAGAYEVPASQRSAVIEDLLELVELTAEARTAVDDLSRGMKQRLSLARALVNDPDLLVLDEPASGLDPRARVELRHLMVKLRDLGKTIIVSSHILAELEPVCSELAVMQDGRVVASGRPDDIAARLAKQRRVRVRYLDGGTEEHEVLDDREQHELLVRLMADGGRPVVELAQVGAGLEELFMSLTSRPEPEDSTEAGS